MADIALVSLALDSSAVVAGEKQATRALQTVDAAMQRTEKQAAQLNTGLNANLKKSGDSFKGLGDSAQRAGAALQGIGGPIGRLGGEIGSLGGQLDTLTGSFGLMGGAALGVVAGVLALGAAFTRLTLEGAAVSDQMGGIAESTGLTIDQVQRLGAAAKLSGEDIGFVERSFRTFEAAVAEAQDSSSKAAANFRTLGIDAKAAGKDTGAAFIDAVANLQAYRSTTEGAAASSELLGRGVGALIRSSANLTEILKANRTQLEATGKIATLEAVEAGRRLDAQIKELSNSWTVFTQNLAASSTGGFMIAAVDDLNSRLRESHGLLDGLIRLLGSLSTSNVSQLVLNAGAAAAPGRVARPQSFFDEWRGGKQTAGGRGLPPPPPSAPAAAAKKVADELKLPIGQTVNALSLLRPVIEYMERQTQYAADAMKALAESDARDLAVTLKNLGTRVERIAEGVPLGIPGAPPGVGGTEIPGELQPRGPRGQDIRTEHEARVDEQFARIFDDFLLTILTAQATLGDAFKGLATGILDTFAREMILSMQKDFIQPLAQGLTNLLKDALGDLFGGLSTKGLKGVFGGIAKGIGTIFGGFFASGGTLGPGKFGIAGERGPELIFAGNQPMHIAPVTAGSAGNVFNISVGVNAPSGSVDKRTQDQLAATVMNAVKRAQRNEGAR